MSRYEEVMDTLAYIKKTCNPKRFVLGSYYESLIISRSLSFDMGSILLYQDDYGYDKVFGIPVEFTDDEYEIDFEV